MSTATGIGAALLALLLHAPADPPANAQEINEAYDRAEYHRAAALLEEAYATDHQPDRLYSKGEILIEAGDCEAAVVAFRRFLATDPVEIDAAAARRRIEQCAPPEPVPRATPPRSEPAPLPRPRTVRRDPVFIGLLSSGAVLTAAGAGLLVGARIVVDRTPDANTEEAWETDVQRSRGLARAGAVILSIGGAVLVGAVVRAVVVRRNGRRG